MAASRYLTMRAMVLAAKRAATTNSSTLTAQLEAVATAQFSSSVQDGKTLINVSEAGGATTWSVVGGLQPDELMSLAMYALSWCRLYPDPENPPLYPEHIRRMRVSFSQAIRN